MKLKPVADHVVIKATEAEETTKSGIVLPKSGIILSSASQEKPQICEVVAVGPGTDEEKMYIKAGQKVVVAKYTGTDIKLADQEYTIIKQADILAIVE